MKTMTLNEAFKSPQDLINEIDPDIVECDYCKRHRHISLLSKKVGGLYTCEDRDECRSYAWGQHHEKRKNLGAMGFAEVGEL